MSLRDQHPHYYLSYILHKQVITKVCVYRKSLQNFNLSLVCNRWILGAIISLQEWKPFSAAVRLLIFQKILTHSEEMDSYCEGPERTPLTWTLQSPWQEKRGSILAKDRKIERNWLWFWLSMVMYRDGAPHFPYQMRSAYAHFPINVVTQENRSLVQIWNLGVKLHPQYEDKTSHSLFSSPKRWAHSQKKHI